MVLALFLGQQRHRLLDHVGGAVARGFLAAEALLPVEAFDLLAARLGGAAGVGLADQAAKGVL